MLLLQESIASKAINFAKNNKGKLIAGAAGLAALGGAAYYANEHGDLGNKPEAPKATEKPEAPKATEKPEAPKATEKPEAPKATEKTEAPKAPEKHVPQYTGTLKEKMNEAAKAGDANAAGKFAKEYEDKQMKAEQPTSTADDLKRKMNEAVKNGNSTEAGKYAKELELVKINGASAADNSKPDTTGIPDIKPKYKYNTNVPTYKANWRNLRTQQN